MATMLLGPTTAAAHTGGAEPKHLKAGRLGFPDPDRVEGAPGPSARARGAAGCGTVLAIVSASSIFRVGSPVSSHLAGRPPFVSHGSGPGSAMMIEPQL